MSTNTPLDPSVHNSPHDTSGAAGEAIGGGVQQPPATTVDLRLEPSPQRPRQLLVRLFTAHHILWADVRVNGILCSSAYAILKNCCLNFNRGYPYLSLDDSTVTLCVEEAAQIRATFEPQGLRIREDS
jgi:hypothetical protein